MAKSARSKSKIAARNARWYTLGTDYQVTHAARLNHVASRLASRLNTPKEGAEEEEDVPEAGESKMEEERPAAPAPAARMSTARRSDSSRKRWRNKQKRR